MFSRSLSLKVLFDILCSVIERVTVKNNDKPICLILDDVSVLLSIGLSVTDIAGFCHYCKLFMLGETEEKVLVYKCMFALFVKYLPECASSRLCSGKKKLSE